ncbi:hypothetical protein ACFLQS_02910 [Actinomycetota bacterium]
MNKKKKNIRDDEMWCPECGAPIKKGFFTCANCRFKVKLTEDINKKQVKKKKPNASEPNKSNKKKKDITEPEIISKPTQDLDLENKKKKELLDDIFEEAAADPENKKPGSRPGWWSYS